MIHPPAGKHIGNILACGCSYTKSTRAIRKANVKEFWPELLAKDLGLECINAGSSGIGNDRIVNKTVQLLTDKSLNIELVVILWTEMFRINLMCNVFSERACNHFRKEMTTQNRWIDKFIEDYFSYIEVIDRLCKKYEVKLLMGQGLSLVSDWQKDPWFTEESDFYKKFADAITSASKPKYFIGWPIIPPLGGYALQDNDQELAKQENWVSDTDAHPNEKGHRIIANEFLKKYKEIYS
jgi:hypothetical protein